MIYTGLNLHKSFSYITSMSDKDEIAGEKKLPSNEGLVEFLKELANMETVRGCIESPRNMLEDSPMAEGKPFINRLFFITLLACSQFFSSLRVIKTVFLILAFSFGMLATFFKRLGSTFPVNGSSPIVPTSGISSNLFRMVASGVGFGRAIVMAVSPFQVPTSCSIRD